MNKIPDRRRGLVRGFSVAAAAILALAAAPGERAQALSPLSPGTVPTAKYASDGLTTEVKHGGGGGHGGGFHGGGGFRGGGGGFHGGGFHGGGFRGGGAAFHGGGFRGGGAAFHHGGFRHGAVFHGARFHHGGHRFVHRHHFHRRFFFAPSYSYSYYPHCRIVWTYYGPRKICPYRPWQSYWGFYRAPIYW